MARMIREFIAGQIVARLLREIRCAPAETEQRGALLVVVAHTHPTGLLWRDAGIVLGCVALTLTLGAATLRRRSA
jgi:hypothetical protein